MTHPVSIAVASLRDNPQDWTVDSHELRHKSGIKIWTANSSYGIELRGDGVRWGGVGILSSFGLSWRHWQLWFVARRLVNSKIAECLDTKP